MKNNILNFVCALTLFLCGFAIADTISGKVVGISDGDTITVLDAQNQQFKIRLAGIDAPEHTQSFGTQSKQNLSNLIYGKMVLVEFNDSDKYGRIIGKVLFDGADMNLLQVKNGYAWHYKLYERSQSPTDRILYATAELKARSQKIGLWLDAKPIPPWNFRHKKD